MSEIKFGRVSMQSEWMYRTKRTRHWVHLESPEFKSQRGAENWLDRLKAKLRPEPKEGK